MPRAIDQFKAAMAEQGLNPLKPIEPGRFNRFPGQGKKRGNTAGWCKLFDDCQGGVYGDYSTGFVETWFPERGQFYTVTERAELKRNVEATRQEAEKQRAAQQERAAGKATEQVARAEPAQEHPYLAEKQISPAGALQCDDKLLLPLQDVNGKVWSTQTIDPEGRKRFMSGGKISGCFYPIGPAITDRVFICEGFATGATLHLYGESIGAKQQPVIVAFNAGNLGPVSVAIHMKYPAAAITIAADNDVNTPGNPGLTKAWEAVALVGGDLVWPNFENEAFSGTDFNDYMNGGGVL